MTWYELQKLRRSQERSTGSRSRTWLAIESLILLLLLIASFAIITHLLASAISRSNESERLENATIVVENVAEEFSADPTSVPERRIVDDFLITCTVEADSTEAGTLYTADIVASDEEGTAYELKTARYVSGVSS